MLGRLANMAAATKYLCCLASLLALALSEDFDLESHPLYQYVYADDPFYNYELHSQIRQDDLGLTTYHLNLTSGTWLDEEWSNWPVWWHWLTIHVPDEVEHPDAGFVYVSSGSMSNDPPGITSDHILNTARYAAATKMVTGVIRQIPNQPISFPNDWLGDRREDSLIAYTWKYFIDNNTTDPEIILRFPMVRGVVRAMDAMTEFTRDLVEGGDIQKFMVAGLSKRGWTTWLTGAVDSRVVAMAPVVLSMVNLRPNMVHHYRCLGGWTFAFFDYWAEGIPRYLHDPILDELAYLIDPYTFRSVMTMPKLIVKGSSDEFFLIDDTKDFFHDLEGISYVWILENTGHSPGGGPNYEQYWNMFQTFYLSVLQNYEMPTFSWEIESDEETGSITLFSPETPTNLTAWWAPSVTPNRRDFRNVGGIPPAETGIVWTADEVQDLGGGYYRAEYPVPEEGWLAFFIKVTYEGLDGRELVYSTEANVIPDELPFEDCGGCLGILT